MELTVCSLQFSGENNYQSITTSFFPSLWFLKLEISSI